MIKEKQSEYGRMESMGFGVGKFKAWVKSQNPLKLLGFGTAIVAAGFGIISLIVHYTDKSKSETRVKENAKKTDDAIRETQAKYDAEAKLYDAKVDADIRKAEALSKIRKERNLNSECAQENSDKDAQLHVEEIHPMTFEEYGQSFEDIKATRLVANLIHPKDKVVLFGPKGQGKSTLMVQLLAIAAQGESKYLFPDFGKQHDGVDGIVLDFEMKPEHINHRYLNPGSNIPNRLKILKPKPFLTPDAMLVYLRDFLEDIHSDLILGIDNLTAALPTLTAVQVKTLFAGLDQLQSDASQRGVTITFVLVAHSNKNGYSGSISTEDLKGSSILADLADVVIGMGPSREGGDVKLLKILHNRDECEQDKVLVMKRNANPMLHFDFVGWEAEAKVMATKPKPTDKVEDNDSCISTDAKTFTVQGKTIPIELAEKIFNDYIPGVIGHGFNSLAKRYHDELVKYNAYWKPMQISRFIDAYKKFCLEA